MAAEPSLRVLIVDDEKTIRRFLKATLVSQGYQVFEAADGREALNASVSAHPDAVILDLGLPDMDGTEVIRQIRKRSKTPIIVHSVREDEPDKIDPLDAGADDYLTKPFNAAEMMARLRAVMRRLLPNEEGALFRAGKLSVDVAKHAVELDGRPVSLTPTEFDVLKILVMSAGNVVTHRQILRAVWNKSEDMEGVSHLLRVTISNLRDKLEPDPDRPAYVLTEPGIGYRLHTDD